MGYFEGLTSVFQGWQHSSSPFLLLPRKLGRVLAFWITCFQVLECYETLLGHSFFKISSLNRTQRLSFFTENMATSPLAILTVIFWTSSNFLQFYFKCDVQTLTPHSRPFLQQQQNVHFDRKDREGCISPCKATLLAAICLTKYAFIKIAFHFDWSPECQCSWFS